MIKSDETKLNVFLHKFLRRILKIYWPMKVTNEEIRFKTNMEEITQQIKRRRWKLIGHVLPEEKCNGGEGTPYNGLYRIRGGSARKGYLFQASRYKKG